MCNGARLAFCLDMLTRSKHMDDCNEKAVRTAARLLRAVDDLASIPVCVDGGLFRHPPGLAGVSWWAPNPGSNRHGVGWGTSEQRGSGLGKAVSQRPPRSGETTRLAATTRSPNEIRANRVIPNNAQQRASEPRRPPGLIRLIKPRGKTSILAKGAYTANLVQKVTKPPIRAKPLVPMRTISNFIVQDEVACHCDDRLAMS